MISLRSDSASTTQAIAAAIAGLLHRGDVVVLDGGLGGGKTTFVQGAVRALGSTEPVTSPTFAIVQEYTQGPISIAHVDAYRLERVQDLHELGFEEMLDGDCIVFIEWGELVRDALPDDHVTVRLHMVFDASDASLDARVISVEPCGSTWTARDDELRAALVPFMAKDGG